MSPHNGKTDSLSDCVSFPSVGRSHMYRHLSLLRLIELIAYNGDKQALRELHDNRSTFYYGVNEPLRLVEFVDQLRQSKPAWRWCNRNLDMLDKAYDLTVGKFSHLPDSKENHAPMKQQGPDCRLYYAAYIRHATKKIETESYASKVEKEGQMATLLQNFVIHHFRLSCLECNRMGAELNRRYLWKVNGATLSVRLPVQIPGSQCSKWLAENIGDVDPARAGERQRVQARIDQLATRQRIYSLDSIDSNEIVVPPPRRSVTEQEIEIKGLAGAIADEKADNIEFQRPAIQKLGKNRLKKMILRIFESLADGDYEASEIAESAGISKATFSRFAGSRWSTRTETGSKTTVPDLWHNTAEALAGYPAFVEAAQTAGLWKRIEQITANNNSTKARIKNE